MSETKNKKVKQKKMEPIKEEVKSEPKKRKSRAKPIPTKEEVLKSLEKESSELTQYITELKEEESKIVTLDVKTVKELVTDELDEMEESLEEINKKIEEIKALPENEEE